MRPTIKSILWLAGLAGAFTSAHAQSNNIPEVQHVIVVIQENRTPTNLFHEDAALVSYGAHVIPPNNQGSCGPNPTSQPPNGKSCTTAMPATLTLTGLPLGTTVDPDHSHYPAWYCTYDSGAMDGACHIHVSPAAGSDISGCPMGQLQYCPYTYTRNDIWDPIHHYGILDPYFNIANRYGFANWMFQTHQGESQQAHLFLFAGTSAPTPPNDTQDQCYDPQTGQYYNCYEWFSAENANVSKGEAAGCTAPSDVFVYEIPPATSNIQNPTEYKGYNSGHPCYSPNTLSDLLDKAGISWRYYAANGGFAYWNAPNMIQDICNPSGGQCNYPSNVKVGNPGLMLDDLGAQGNCDLQAVTWVIPDGSWSDHPGTGTLDAGPSWVAAIVNAVGNYDNSGNQLRNPPCSDTISGQQVPYWQDTVVLVVWDDWGGFYDDVLPWNCDASGTCNGYPGQPSSRDYVYGFRVPLLAVGAYTNQICTPSIPPMCRGYVSGTAGQGGETPPYVHDFGSILNFIEYAFGQNGKHLGDPGGIGGFNNNGTKYPYADWWAPDGPNNPNCVGCTYSLYDFFSFGQLPHAFSPIQGAKYLTSYFYSATPGQYFSTYPSDPDDDLIDPQ